MGISNWFKRRPAPKAPDPPEPFDPPNNQPSPSFSDAYHRFSHSTKIGYNEWHDGIPYDLDAFRALSSSERDMIVREFAANHGPAFDWRDIEVFQAAATPESISALRAALQSARADSRLYAAAALHAIGDLPDLAAIVARELDYVTILDGQALALRLIGGKLTPAIREALLRGARDRPEVGPHYAAMLCYLVGKAASDFDWNMRPFFLRFGEHASRLDRAQAYRELCELIKNTPPQI
jgi:hypothetical protein